MNVLLPVQPRSCRGECVAGLTVRYVYCTRKGTIKKVLCRPLCPLFE